MKKRGILYKTNQTGSMMIEALAMLTLISLVTPTLYKKSAERTTELQDINSATHARTLMKAVDNYVSSNYPSLVKEIKDDTSNTEQTLTKTMEDIAAYLPYGYTQDEPIKNFDTPHIVIKKQDNADSLTAFVIFPNKGEMNGLRSSRIASMIGSNGGYVNDAGAQGVGGVWSLSQEALNGSNGLCNNCAPNGSIVTVSSESINNASRVSFENTKYLQRTKEDDSNNEKWRNTMMTDLYLGGTPKIGNESLYQDYSSIYGVNRLIIGGTNLPNSVAQTGESGTENLVIRKGDHGEGNAFIGGTLKALGGAFSLSGTTDAPVLNFADYVSATGDTFTVGDTSSPALEITTADGALFSVDTMVDAEFTTTGDTTLASNGGVLRVGDNNGEIIYADNEGVQLLDDKFVLSKPTSGDSSLTVDTTNINLKGKTTVGEGTAVAKLATVANRQAVGVNTYDPKLNVQGDAFVSGTLEAGALATDKFNTLELHAGAQNYSDTYRLLNADATNGVVIKDKKTNSHESVERFVVNDDEIIARDKENKVRLSVDENGTPSTYIYGPEYRIINNNVPQVIGQGRMYIGDTNAALAGIESTYIDTINDDGFVQIQKGAIEADGHWDSTRQPTAHTNTVTVRANTLTGNLNQFTIQDHTSPTPHKLLNVVSNNNNLDGQSVAEISPNAVNIWADQAVIDPAADNNKHILKVDTSSATAGDSTRSDQASVYIRRGAIELESSKDPNASSSLTADQGLGYIEASRFVANNKTAGGNLIVPVASTDRSSPLYGGNNSNLYDRYMINPAYTSVMHDIKLTTRGGARLSDILPDFINKGIYIVNNTYPESADFNDLRVSVNSDGMINPGVNELNTPRLGEANKWASPFLGMVPAPICPPGHASVITLTPASFQMGQAGDMVSAGANRGYYVNEATNVNEYAANSDGRSIPTAESRSFNVYNESNGSSRNIYYLGWDDPQNAGITSPKPLYFQQSTWLKSKVVAYNSSHACGISGQDCNGFLGWATVMGFIYPKSLYQNVISSLTGSNVSHEGSDAYAVYWNVFPVRALSMEAYATVYCYFDRTNIYNSGNNAEYTDQYDQMYHFRKEGEELRQKKPETYRNRLNDPALKYNDPW